ncbi:MAG: hypothetical protein J7L14_03435, partial [Candidatus Diapherotrites archaeon]|nr:hypothetical protein [Candidatus Diapherotrites archaeon]
KRKAFTNLAEEIKKRVAYIARQRRRGIAANVCSNEFRSFLAARNLEGLIAAFESLPEMERRTQRGRELYENLVGLFAAAAQSFLQIRRRHRKQAELQRALFGV